MKKFMKFIFLVLFAVNCDAASIEDVSKKIASCLPAEKKHALAVLDFDYINKADTVSPKLVQERLATGIASSKNIVLVERNLIEKVLSELHFQASGLVDPQRATRIGEMLQVDYILTGTLTDLQNGEMEINARAISVASSTVCCAEKAVVSKNWVAVVSAPSQNASQSEMPFRVQASKGNILVKSQGLARGEKFGFYFRDKYLGQIQFDKGLNVVSSSLNLPDGAVMFFGKKEQPEKEFVFLNNQLSILRTYNEVGVPVYEYSYQDGKTIKSKNQVETAASQNLLADAKTYKDGDKIGFKDKYGNILVPAKFDQIYNGWESNTVVFEIHDKYGFMDARGKEVLPAKYDYMGYFREGRAAVKLANRWGFVDLTGKEISPLKYDEVRYFYSDRAAVKRNGKWGFINKYGEEVIPVKYSEVWDFDGGIASVRLNSKSGTIDKSGTEHFANQ